MEPLCTASEYFLARGRTYIKVRGKWNYHYRAVDKHGKTVDFLLRPDRGIAAAQAFFRKALSWWEDSSLFGVRPLLWPASNLPIGYARDNSRLGAVDIKNFGSLKQIWDRAFA
jgi:hypothetical protein